MFSVTLDSDAYLSGSEDLPSASSGRAPRGPHATAADRFRDRGLPLETRGTGSSDSFGLTRSDAQRALNMREQFFCSSLTWATLHLSGIFFLSLHRKRRA